jgi:hypothetical protein
MLMEVLGNYQVGNANNASIAQNGDDNYLITTKWRP